MRKSVQKALANKRPQKQFQGSGEVTNYEPGGSRKLPQGDTKSARRIRTKIIEDSFGHLPVR